MNYAICGLRTAQSSSYSPSFLTAAQFTVRCSRPSIGKLSDIAGDRRRIVVHRRWQTATAVVREEAVDRLNGPPSTRPPPLVTAESDPNENVLMRLVKLGKGYVTFYKTGVKQVWTNFRESQRIRAVLKAEAPPNTPLHALPRSVLSRADFLLLHRSGKDMKRIPVFALILLVCGEFTPLIVPFIIGIVPSTCRIPSQVTGALKTLESRRSESFRNLVTPPPSPPTDISPTASPAQSYIDSLTREQLLHISRSLNLHSRRWPDQNPALPLPPTSLLRRRVRRAQKYLETDDKLIERDGDVQGLISEELHTACIERGLDTLNKSDAKLRALLRSWLWLSRGKEGWGIFPLLLTRPSAWPSSSPSTSSSSASASASPSLEPNISEQQQQQQQQQQ